MNKFTEKNITIDIRTTENLNGPVSLFKIKFIIKNIPTEEKTSKRWLKFVNCYVKQTKTLVGQMRPQDHQFSSTT